MNPKKPGHNKLFLGAATLFLLPFTVSAVEVGISGQVNRIIMNIDNGEEDGLVHADNSNSGTRWRFEGEGDMTDDVQAGLLYETQLQSNPSSAIEASSLDSDGINGNVGGGDLFSTRFAIVWFKGRFGKVTLGQGSGASDGSAEIDNSGTTVVQYSGSSNDLLGSMEFGDSGIVVNDVRSNFDGLGRNDNLRYDAAIGDVTLAASIGNGDKIEGSIIYAIESFKLMFGVWDEQDSGNGVSGNALSASWTGASGFNLSAALSGNDSDGDPSNAYIKAGYRHGDHAFAIDWSETSDLGPGDADSYSIAWVGQMMQGVELYASYRLESLDVSGADDISALSGGARIKF